jgi:hypothetical protein
MRKSKEIADKGDAPGYGATRREVHQGSRKTGPYTQRLSLPHAA